MLKKLLFPVLILQFALAGQVQAQTAGCPELMDQGTDISGTGMASTDHQQSFTAGMTGKMTRFDVRVNGTQTVTLTLSIYSGTGVGGTLLYTQAYNMGTISTGYSPMNIPIGSAPTLTSGSVYTVRIQCSSAFSTSGNSSNSYAGGYYNSPSYGSTPSWDMRFKTYITGTVYPTATAGAGGATEFCQGGNVNLTANTGSFTYQWNNGATPIGGATSQTYAATAGGNYNVTVTNTSTQCWNTSTPDIPVIVDPLPVVTIASSTNVSCNGGSNGAATTSVSSGTPSYNYSWAPSGGTGSSVSGRPAGNYTVTVTDSKTCVGTQTVSITQPAILDATTSSANVSCFGGSNGTATCTATGGTAAYSYSWAPSGGSASTASGLAPGNYTCTINDSKGCSTTKTFTITQPPALTATTGQTDLLCFGASTGSATVTPSGGTPGYTYAWAPSGGSAATTSGRTAGNYTCTITDTKGCSLQKTFTLTQPTLITPTLASSTNVSCNGGNNGAASLSVSGGTPGYTYSWAPSGGTASSASSLTAQTYTCTVTDANACPVNFNVTITQPAALSAGTSQVNVSCNGGNNGSATVTASGGTAGYTYSWAPSGGTAATASSLTQGGYTCTITDTKGCTLPKAFTITEPAVLTSGAGQTNILCNGASTGSMTVTPSGGTPGYTYAWTPSGGSSATAVNRAAGNYTCTITDTKGCSVQKTFTLTEPPALTATTGQTNILCNGAATGSATVTPSGGNGAYTYSWAPSGGTGSSASGLTATNYTCTITDANGCTLPKTFTLTQPALLTATTSFTNVLCNGGSTGTATVNASGGNGAYSYSWAPSGGNAATATGLAQGNYTCTITDANSCSIQKTFSITQPTALTASTFKNNVTCFGLSDGDATINVSGGTTAYSYAWAPGGGTASTASGLSAALYTCTVTDANGCQISKTVNITQPAPLSAAPSQTNVSCHGLSDGSASVVITGGTVAYTYSWAPSGGSASSATGLAAGTYSCNITDGNSCPLQSIITITEPATLSGTLSPTAVSCNGLSDGSILAVASGGTASYTYAWAPSGGNAATASNLAAGTYSCTITDAHSCSTTAVISVSQPSALAAVATSTDVTCNGFANGTAMVSVSGGTTSYSYSWSPSGGSAANANGLSGGTYTCTITDANNCGIQKTVTIAEPSALAGNATINHVSCNGANDGSVTISASGAIPAYSYSWLPNISSTSSASNMAPGTYSCTISDQNSCTLTLNIVVTEPAVLAATVSSTNVTCNAANNGSASVVATGGTMPYTYAWSPSGGTNANASNLAPATYTCTITDAHNCSAQQVVTITEPAALTVVPTSTNVLCNGGNTGTAAVSASGGTGTYTYSWSPSGGNASSATALAANTYTCTTMDANNCSVQTVITITQPAALAATSSQVNVACNAGTNGSASVSVTGGTGAYTYSWSPSGGSGATATGLSATNYTCTITDANSCSITKTFTLTEPSALTANGTSINSSCFGGSNGSAAVAVNGGSPGYTYSWSPSGGSTANASGLSAGNYTCTITDTHGCIVTKNFTITQPATGVSVSVTTVPAACNTSNGSATASVSGGTPPYIYLWSSGSNQPQADSLAAGQYFLQVYDNVGCYSSKVVTVNNTNAPAVSLGSLVNVSCYAGNNGAISVNVSGGASPYTYLWSNGAATASLTGLPAGPYDVTITDANNCTVSQTYTVTQPLALTAVFSMNPATCGASDGDATVTVSGGTASYNYLWSANAGGQTTATATALSSGLYSVSVMDAMGCQVTSVGTVSSANSTLAVTVDTVIQGGCSSNSSGSIDITATGGTLPYTFNWNNGATTEDISGLSPGNYVVLVTDSNNCSASQTIHVASSMDGYQPEICLVTVDTATMTNLVVWEKTLTQGILSYKIYRETSTPGVYQVIGTSPYDSLSQFTDPVANPQVRSWRYKITAVDSCGIQTPMSQPHKTIHLAQNPGFSGSVNLAWDYYDGFSYSTYFIWRHDPSTGWVKIDSLPVTLTSYTDLTPPSANSRYMIEIIPPSSCTSTRGAINTSRSNIKVSTVGGTTGIASASSGMQLSVFPNPATDQLTVRAEQKDKEKMNLRMLDALGRVVFEKAVEASSLNEVISLSGFDNGLYLLEVRTSKGVKQVKVVKQQ